MGVDMHMMKTVATALVNMLVRIIFMGAPRRLRRQLVVFDVSLSTHHSPHGL
jgi:hypothetical protein